MLLTALLLAQLAVPADAAPADSLARARALLDEGRSAEARALLEELVAAAPEDGAARDARLALAEAWMAEGVPQSALGALDPVASRDDFAVTLAMGRAFRAWGDDMVASGSRPEDTWFAYDEARAKLERAAEIAPAGDPRATVALAGLLLYTYDEPDRARELAEAAAAAHPDHPEVRLLRGCVRVQEYWQVLAAGDERGAQKLADAALGDLRAAADALAADRPEPWAQLAWLHEQRGEAEQAVEAARALVERDPLAGADTLYALAVRYAGEDELEAASRALLALAHRRPAELTALLAAEQSPTAVAQSLAWAAVQLRSPKDVLAVLDPIMAAGPEDAAAWNNYGFALREAARYEDAWRAYERSVELDDTDPRVLNDAAVVLDYYLRRETGRAGELYARAIELAERELRRPGLTSERKSYLRGAKHDAETNLARLRDRR